MNSHPCFFLTCVRNVPSKQNHRSVASLAVVGLCAALLTGCGGSGEELPDTAPVRGKVTYNGKPLPGGTVMFHPQQEGQGNPATGDIQEDGTYELTTYNTKDGAVLGPHKVTVQVFPGQRGFPEHPLAGLPGAEDQIPSPIPEKYTSVETTDLKATVVDGENEHNLKLED